MATYRGRFRYSQRIDSASEQDGSCQIQFDDQTFTLTPDSGAPLVFDLGDLDAVSPADYAIRLPLYTGKTITLHQFGKSYETLSRELVESFRKRTLECLLLADLEAIDRFTGEFALETSGAPAVSGSAEIRLFKTNLAVLPDATQAFQWRLADVEALRFDAERYEVLLEAGGSTLRIGRLGKRTELCRTRLRDAIDALKAEGGEALHAILPFLNADELRAVAEILPEGRSVSTAALAAIDLRIPDALAMNAVDEELKPYYEDLVSRTAVGLSFAGFKLIRPEDRDVLGGDTDDQGPGGAASPAALYWFFFSIAAMPGSAEPGNVVAWEGSSSGGRATYFFRLFDPPEGPSPQGPTRTAAAVEHGIERITRVLGLLNFRRRPIYLSSDELTGRAVFHRYAIAERKIPELRQVRAAFLGRAIHSSLDAWRTQVAAILERSRI